MEHDYKDDDDKENLYFQGEQKLISEEDLEQKLISEEDLEQKLISEEDL
nr:FLAG-TEV cut site-3xmyc tag [Cloning vector pCtFEM3ki-kanMX6]